MSAANALKVVRDQNRELIEARATDVTKGNLSFEQYQNVCGQLRGLQLANDNIESLLRTIEENDD